MQNKTQTKKAAQGQNLRERYKHDVCPKCGTASVPVEKVPDQALRGCPSCGHTWFEDLEEGATLGALIEKLPILDARRARTKQPLAQADHSPLPWKLLDGAILSEKVNDYGNFIIVESPRRYADETTEQDKRNMMLIVRSVNNAEKLAEALREIFKQCACVHKYWGEGCNQREADAAVTQASAALAQWDSSQ